jgi:hypothetical protein
MTRDTRSMILLLAVLILAVLVVIGIEPLFDPMKAWLLTHLSSPQYFPTPTFTPR